MHGGFALIREVRHAASGVTVLEEGICTLTDSWQQVTQRMCSPVS